MTSALSNVDAALAEVEAYIPYDPTYCPLTANNIKNPFFRQVLLGSLMSNYLRLPSWYLIRRSYEAPTRLYFLVFKPFNKNYNAKKDLMDHVRKKIGSGHKAVVITREINATKVHYNAMILTNKPDLVTTLHNKQTNIYKITCKECPLADKYRVHDYITKESRTRYFYDTKTTWHNKDIYITK